jgi:hypothetical protein
MSLISSAFYVYWIHDYYRISFEVYLTIQVRTVRCGKKPLPKQQHLYISLSPPLYAKIPNTNIEDKLRAGELALYRKIVLCIPKNEIARPRSQFLHSWGTVRDLYIPRIGLPIWLQQNSQTYPGNI